MDKAIIDNYKATVKEDDTVYYLGDLTLDSPSNFWKIQNRIDGLPGQKHFILGNHDRFKPFAYHNLGFESVHTVLYLTFDGDKQFCLVHDPAWATDPTIPCIAGHVHEKWRSRVTEAGVRAVNVGVDVWDFKPVSLPQVLDELSRAHR